MSEAKERTQRDADGGGDDDGGGGSPLGVVDGGAPADDKENGARGGGKGGGKRAGSESRTQAQIMSVDSAKGEVLAMAPGCGLRPFSFERAFGEDASQAAVYDSVGRPAVVELVNGRSGCVLVYGQ